MIVQYSTLFSQYLICQGLLPFSKLIWVATATAKKHDWWRLGSCRNLMERHLKSFRRLLTVSWRARALFLARLSDLDTYASGFQIKLGSPRYPLSASTFSPRSNMLIKAQQKILTSGQRPHGKGPLIHTISPVLIQTATSYRRPAFLNLWEYHLRLNGVGSWIGQSVPSTVTLHVLVELPRKRFSQQIFAM